jgi:hypothetical protein
MAMTGGVPEFPASQALPVAEVPPPVRGVPRRPLRGPRSRRVADCPAVVVRRPVATRRIPAGPARRGVRLTRRGRVVVFVLLAVLAGLAAVLVASASRAADQPGPLPTTVVRPGDTLWSVAERHDPGPNPFGVIEEIRRLNGLADYTVQPGQQLVLPHRR